MTCLVYVLLDEKAQATCIKIFTESAKNEKCWKTFAGSQILTNKMHLLVRHVVVILSAKASVLIRASRYIKSLEEIIMDIP